jgi:hypothetical protein
MLVTNSNYSVQELLDMIDRKELTINSDYQRGTALWPDSASAYFIDTIINKFIFPKIYIYGYFDRKQRRSRKELVDGQQRISAIRRFVDDDFTLRGEGENFGKKFSQLDEETQAKILSYIVPVDVISDATTSDILQMFRRMNSYTLPLNEAEKRHASYQGSFKWFTDSIANILNEYFIEYGVLSKRQISRMNDAALITDCILAFESGIVSSSPKLLDGIYKKYDEEFVPKERYREIILHSVDYIVANFSDLRLTYLMKPYAWHSLITAMVHCKYGIQAITDEYGINSIGAFCADPKAAGRALLAMAHAHEARELEGPYGKYVWGCVSSTDRKPRRAARVASMLRALGAKVPGEMDADLA